MLIVYRRWFVESPGNSSGPKSCFIFAVFTFKIKVKDDTIQQVLISKSALRPEKFPGLSRNGPLANYS